MQKHTTEPSKIPAGHEAIRCERIKRGLDGNWSVVVETWWQVEPLAD